MNDGTSRGRFSADDQHLANLLFGRQNRNLKQIERTLGVRIGSKGAELSIEGDALQVDLARRLLEELYGLLKEGYP
ncbi:MAG: KH domain-containing protein, partial [Desulfuromonadales bacterium]